MTARKSRNRFTLANIRFHAFRTILLPILPLPKQTGAVPPVVVGAMGGSGTRLLPSILRLADFWMGAWINPQTQDAMAPRYFLQHHFSQLANHHLTNDQTLVDEFLRVIAAHRWGMPSPSGRWGWKNPRNMWIIPFLAHVYPEMKFIHVVRDGRDMALSDNTNLLHKHGAFLLHDPVCESRREAAQLRLWTLGNRIAYDDGKKYLGSNYFIISYEDLCIDPRPTVIRLFDFLCVPVNADIIESACQLIVPPSGIGKWKKSDIKLLHEPDQETRDALRLFGYDAGETVADGAPSAESIRRIDERHAIHDTQPA